MLDGCTPWPEEFVDRYWSAGHWRGYTLDNLLRTWALDHGPRTALVHGDTRLTYAALNRRVDRTAAGFRLRGLRPGQRVVVQLPNVPEFVVTVFALMRIGAVPVLCPMEHRTETVSHVVRVAQAAGYVGTSAYGSFDPMAMAAGIAAQGPWLRRVFTYEAPGTSSPYGGATADALGCHYFPLGSVDAPPGPAAAQRPDDVAFLLLSDDGSEGNGDGERVGGDPRTAPRLVPRTHNDYAYQARAAGELVSLGADDVYLAVLPAAADFALGRPGILGTFCVGGTVVLADERDPAAGLPLVERERVTLTSLTPAAAASWLAQLPSVQVDLSSLRLVQTGGAPVPRATAERIGPALGCRLQQVHGAPGGLLTLTRPADPDAVVFGTRGRPLSPDDEIRVVDTDGKDVPDGTPGELLARGPYIPRGSYRAPDHDARTHTADGYLRTGTVARLTPDGDVVVPDLDGRASRSR